MPTPAKVVIFNASAGYRAGYTMSAMSVASEQPETVIALIGQGPLMGGRIETGECWPCRNQHPERLPDLWIWEGIDCLPPERREDPREWIGGWTGLCNDHAEELHGVSLGKHPDELAETLGQNNETRPWSHP